MIDLAVIQAQELESDAIAALGKIAKRLLRIGQRYRRRQRMARKRRRGW